MDTLITYFNCRGCDAPLSFAANRRTGWCSSDAVLCAKEKRDPVAKPAHYNTGPIECWDAIKADLGDNYRYYVQGNVLKYVWRHEYKGKQVEDLEKARAYLDELIREVKRLTKQ